MQVVHIPNINDPLFRTAEERLVRAQILRINKLMRQKAEAEFVLYIKQRIGVEAEAQAFLESQGLSRCGKAAKRKAKPKGNGSPGRARPLSARPLTELELNVQRHDVGLQRIDH